MDSSKFLITGCAGFIGSHVCEYLLKRGDLVLGIDNINAVSYTHLTLPTNREV